MTSATIEKKFYLPLLLLPGGVLLAWAICGAAWPRWIVMWLMAAAIFIGCKWLTWRAARPMGVPGWKQAAYLLLWPGLDAEAFFFKTLPRRIPRPVFAAWLLAAFNLILGCIFFWIVARAWPETWWWASGWTGMAGFILFAHCGLFQLISYAWQTLGIQARPLMNWPLRSQNVSEFWSRRWNTAFRDLAHRFLFQPLARRWGPRRALLAGFFFSGLVHELVVTIPAGGGYGGPTLFFSCQGAAILFERSRTGRTFGLNSGLRGQAFTIFELLATVGFAFPAAFVKNIVLPFMHAAGAL